MVVATVGALVASPAAALVIAGLEKPVFPKPGQALPTNGRIVIDIDGREQPMELRAKTDRVALKVVQTNVDAIDKTAQVVLVPARALRPLTSYELYFSDEDRPVPVGGTWTTTAGADRAAPRWRSAPKVNPGVSEPISCIRNVFVPISVPFDGDADAVLILAEVRPIGGAVISADDRAKSRYLLRPHGDEIRIGRGRFMLEPGRRYTVKLTAVDAAGNRTPAPGRPVEIVGPAATAALDPC